MEDYKKMYYQLYNTVTDAERILRGVTALLQTAQQQCEEMYLMSEDPPSLSDNADKK